MGTFSLGLSIADAKAAKSQAEYEEQQLRQNAYFNKLKGEDAIKRGDAEAAQLERQTKQLIGSQRAGYAAQGIDIESGSALAVQQDTAVLSAEDQMTIKNNAWREAWGYRVEEQGLYGQAEMTRLAGKNAYKQGILTGIFNAVQTGMSSASRYSKYNEGESPKSMGSSSGGIGSANPSGRASRLSRQLDRYPAGTPSGYRISNSRTSWERD
jgi:hypothetical protein